jgi:hypothetical protein
MAQSFDARRSGQIRGFNKTVPQAIVIGAVMEARESLGNKTGKSLVDPNHRESFNSLLHAAERKRERED